jgi:hypothetical protein
MSDDDKITRLPGMPEFLMEIGANRKPVPAIVILLRELLDQALSGQMQGIAVASYSRDGTFGVAWRTGTVSHLTLLGCIAKLEHDFATVITEN